MSSATFISGLLIGAAIGTATGLLIAPTSGNQTRRKILSRSRAYSQQAIDAVRQYLDNIKSGRVEVDLTAEEVLNRYRTESNV